MLSLTLAVALGTDPNFALAWASAAQVRPPAHLTPPDGFALAWASARPCVCNGTSPNCPCGPGRGQPTSTVAPTAPSVVADPKYATALARAKAEKKSLVVFVDYPCMACAQATPDCVHCFLDGPFDGVTKGVVVGRNDGTGLCRTDLTADYSVAAIKAALYPALAPSFTVGSPCGPQGCGVPFGAPLANGWTGFAAPGNCPTCR